MVIIRHDGVTPQHQWHDPAALAGATAPQGCGCPVPRSNSKAFPRQYHAPRTVSLAADRGEVERTQPYQLAYPPPERRGVVTDRLPMRLIVSAIYISSETRNGCVVLISAYPHRFTMSKPDTSLNALTCGRKRCFNLAFKASSI